MKKLNGFESYLVIEGLNAIRNEWKKDIREVEAQGKNALMTADYVDMVVSETIEKIKALTLKQK
jgi:hypothetical protein